jgi:hypothetical protein
VKGGGPALIIGVGKPKKGMGEDMPDDGDEGEEMSQKDMHLSDAFDAVKEGDREGFVEAMKKCLLAADEGAYSGPDEGDED